jgi:FkbM family methyltransferase
MNVRSNVKSIARRLGFDISSYDPRFSVSALKKHLINTIKAPIFVDIGANTGQFALRLRQLGYQGVIHSIEPGSQAFSQLCANASCDSLWKPHQFACGAESCSSTLHVSQNSYSSSLLPNTSLNLMHHPDVIEVDRELSNVRRLDEWLDSLGLADDRFALKIDVQGFEDSVLQGAEGVIDRVSLLIIELSIAPMQVGQKLFHKIMPYLTALGFKPVIIEPCDVDYRTHEILQLDVWLLGSESL